jgi:SAM-dependent methyltransferase
MFDANQYKANQLRGWDSVAHGWQTWGEVFDASMQPVSDLMMRLAQVQPGQTVLDIATGTGEPGLTAARAVGPTGRVVLTDQAPHMLAIARARATALGLHQTEFLEVDAEAASFEEATFDAILSRLGFMYLPNLDAALARYVTILRPGGRLAAVVWSAPDRAIMPAKPYQIASQMLQVPPPPPGTPGPFMYGDGASLEAKFRAAGLSGVQSQRIMAYYRYASPEEFVRYQQDVGAPLLAMLAGKPIEIQDQVWAEIAAFARAYQDGDGTVSVPGELICVVGRRDGVHSVR